MIQFTLGYFGWLGNQMFQYAATYAASKRLNTTCGFPQNKPNLFELFNITGHPVDTYQNLVYHEPHFHYAPIPEQDHINLHGYFQSEKYFVDYKQDIKREFSLKNPKYPDKLDQEYIGLHVRRGDYLNYPDIHPTCSLDYYQQALEMLPDKPVKIFTDDPEWCRKSFSGDRFEVSDKDFIEDFELLTKCSYNIIANSSFSWWGAWLSDSKKVIAPKQWFGPKGPGSAEDIIPDTWIKI